MKASEHSTAGLDLELLGASHKTLPLKIREHLNVSSDELPTVLAKLVEPGGEGLVLSTCNRIEVYQCGLGEDRRSDLWEVLVRRNPDLMEINGDSFYRASGLSVGHHLFRVAAGLESQIVGEGQILGQVREAHRRALEEGAAGVVLDRLFRQAIRVGKRVRTETELGSGATSHGAAAVELAQRVFGDLSQHSVLLIGAGETGKLLARQLAGKRVGRLQIANRTPSRAERLVRSIGGEALPYDRILEALGGVDLVISSTSSSELVVGYEQVAAAARSRAYRPLLIVDLAVPRDFDERVGGIEGCFLKGIEDLDSIIEANIRERSSEVISAERIVGEEVGRLENWVAALGSEPTIRSLRTRLDGVLGELLERHGRRFRPEDREQLEAFAQALLSRVLHGPIRQMKEMSDRTPLGRARLALVRELFDLGDEGVERER